MIRTTACSAVILTIFGTAVLSAQDKDIRTVVDALANAFSKGSKKTVAVVDFNDLQGDVTELGRYLAEEVPVGLAVTDKFLSEKRFDQHLDPLPFAGCTQQP